jgi:hypothetical protein
MAVRGWKGSIATAIGMAAGVGAAQCGLGYGLDIIAWLPATHGDSESAWLASLAWATWIGATSVAAGAVCAERFAGPTAPSTLDRGTARPTRAVGVVVLWRLALAVAAAVGALVTVALIAVPARAAQRVDTFSPQTIAAGYTVVGVMIGLVVAVAALASRAIAANVITTVTWLWLLAVGSVVEGAVAGRAPAGVHLGIWRITADDPSYWFRYIYLPGAALALGAALVIGGLAAWPAARRADRRRIGVAVSGAFGPLLTASAYFLAAPRLTVGAEQLSAYLVAPYAVIAGLAGSVLASAVGGRRASTRPTAGQPVIVPPQAGQPETGEKPHHGGTVDRFAPSAAEPSAAPAAAQGGKPATARGTAASQAQGATDTAPAKGRAGRGGRAAAG